MAIRLKDKAKLGDGLNTIGTIDGLTLAGGGITGTNYNIAGVNQLTIADPGEGIVFTGTNNVTLAAIDDAADNIMNFGGAAELRVNNVRVLTTGDTLNSDTVDSLHAASFLRSDADSSTDSSLTVNGQFNFNSSTNSNYNEGIRLNRSTTGWGGASFGGVRNSTSGITDAWWVARNPSKNFVISYATSGESAGLTLPHNSSNLTYKNHRIWNANDFANNSGNWNTAYGWGDHSTAGYSGFNFGASDLTFQGADPGDIVWKDASGTETHRLWSGSTNHLTYRLNGGTTYAIIHAGNVSNYALPLGGGTLSGTIIAPYGRFRNSQTNNNYTTAALWTESYNTTTTGIAFHISGVVGKFLEMRTDGVLYWQNSEVLTDSIGLRSNVDDSFSGALTSTSRNNGIFGTYDSTKTDHIWSMGTAYKNSSTGANFGNLYGLAYKHTNNTTGGTMGGGHQAVWAANGSPKASLGESGIWTIGYLATDSYQGRSKLRLWDTDTNYAIGFKSGYTFGHIANEYAMSFQMDSTANRGFWWGKNTHSDAQGGMALTSDGKLNVAKSISIGEGETTTSPSTTPLYVLGQTNGETVLDIQGTNGQLFSITDNLEGSLLAVSDISGIPVLDVKASGEVKVDGNINQTTSTTNTFTGAITSTGDITGANLSGTNTGDQTLPTAASLGAVTLTGNQTISGTKTFDNGSIVISGTHGTISFMDTTSGEDNFYLHANSNNFYVLVDRDATDSIDGGYDNPHALQLEGDTNTAYVFGSALNISNWDTAYGWGDHGTAGYLSSMSTVLPTSGNYQWSASTTAGNYTTGLQLSFVRAADGWPDYGTVLHVGGRGGGDAGGDYQIYCGHGSGNGGNHLRFRNADNSASTSDAWTAFKTIWDSENLVNNQSDWNTAYGWGDHGTAGYLTSFDITTQTDARYIRSDAADTATHRIIFSGCQTNNHDTIATAAGSQGSIEILNTASGNDAFMAFHAGADYALYFGLDADTNKLAVGGWSMGASKYAIYHEGNKPTLADLGYTGATDATNNTGTLTNSNDRNFITDSRGAARLPSYYDDRYAQWDFQNYADTGVGGDGWHALLTVSKWSSYDATHRQEQLIFSGDHLWRRTATSDTVWGTNKKIWDSGNLTNNNQLSNGSGFLTSNIGGTKLSFISGAGGSTFAANHYSMGVDTANGAWSSPNYSDLIIGYHTGIRLGAAYSGIRFYNNSPTTDTDNTGNGNGGEGLIMTVGGAAGSTDVSVVGTIVASNFSGASSGTNTGDQTTITGNAATSTITDGVKIRGFGNNEFTFHQASGTFEGYSGWHNYLISNHGNGSNYYNTIIAMPFWGPPKYSRREGNVYRGPYAFCTNETDFTTTFTLQAGTLRSTGDVVAYYSSDSRLKDNIIPIGNAIDKIKQLGGYEFDWNDNQSTFEGHDYGVIAQEVEKVFPELVKDREDGYKGVRYEKLAGVLIEGIKEQQITIENQQKQIDELKEIVGKLINNS